MLNVWKYGHLCEYFTFIGYLCEICSMCKNMTFIGYLCENMAIWCLARFCFWSVCSFWSHVFSFWYTLYWIWQLSSFWWRKRETRYGGMSPMSRKGRRVLWGHVSLLPNSTKKTVNRIFPIECSLHQHATCSLAHIRPRICSNRHPMGPMQEAPRRAQAIWGLRSP
jgi:hypothetical protein